MLKKKIEKLVNHPPKENLTPQQAFIYLHYQLSQIGGKVNEIIDILNEEVIKIKATETNILHLPPNASKRDREIAMQVLKTASEETLKDVEKLKEALDVVGLKDFQVETITLQ